MASDANDGSPRPIDMSGVESIPRQRLADQVAAAIRNFIIERDLQEGTRLPAERSLAELFGASRPTVSQAIRTLSLMGLVESRRGSGAYVMRRPDKLLTSSMTMMLGIDDENIEHVVQLRHWLETLSISQVIARRSDAGMEQARQALDRLAQSTGEISRWMAADTIFHATVVAMAGNPFLTSIYESVHTALIEYEYEQWVEDDTIPEWLEPGRAKDQLALHAPIVDAIERGSLEDALTAVKRHNDVMREHLLSRKG